jgi:hypothetical protein
MVSKLLFIALMCLSLIPAAAQDKRVVRGFNFQTENDVFSGLLGFKNEDKDYSGSFRFEFYTDFLRQGIFPLFRNREDNPNDETKPQDHNANSIYMHGMGFTPNRDAFPLTTIDNTQRPYSSVFGFGWKRVATFSEGPVLKLMNLKRESSIVSDIFVGKVGLKLPGDVQNFLHEYITNSDIVMGWENQIGTGGRWIFNYRVLSHVKVTTSKNALYVSPQASIGNLFINGGAKISLSNQLPGTMGMIVAMPSLELKTDFPAAAFPTFWSHFRYEVYLRMLYIQRNTLLQGLPFYDNSPYTIQKDEIAKFVTDTGAKLIFMYYPDAHRIRSTFAYFEVVHRSKEFNIGPAHVFGNLGFTIINR